MNNEIVDWKSQMETMARATAAMERPTTAAISLRAGIMQYQGVAVPGNAMEAVIVSHGVERAFYTNAWDPNKVEIPACFALSITGDKDMEPHKAVEEPQSETCDTCTHNAWVDNPKQPGKKHKECKEKRRLVLMPKASLAPGEIAKAELASMSLPVTSIKNWAAYVNLCSNAYQRPPMGMLTKILVKPHIKNQFEVTFEPIGMVEEKFLGEVFARQEQANQIVMAPYEKQPEAPTQKAPEKDSKKKY